MKSETWYSQKLAEELQKTETKQKFIERELKEIQQKIAIEHQNASGLNEGKRNKKKEAIIDENRRDLLTPKINKIRKT